MADLAYLTPDQFKRDTMGWQLDTIDDIELEDILLRASQLIDDYTDVKTWGYQNVVDEVHVWNGFSKPITLRKSPVRILQSFKVLVGTSITYPNTLSTGFSTIPVTPTGPSWLGPGELPTQFGYLILDRDIDQIQISMTNFNTRLIGLPWVQGLSRPKILVSYTAGYNPAPNADGSLNLGADGYNLPAPTWLQAATRLTAGALIGDRNVRAEGLGDVLQVRQGDSEFRMKAASKATNTRELAASLIPREALVYLDRRHRTVML